MAILSVFINDEAVRFPMQEIKVAAPNESESSRNKVEQRAWDQDHTAVAPTLTHRTRG